MCIFDESCQNRAFRYLKNSQCLFNTEFCKWGILEKWQGVTCFLKPEITDLFFLDEKSIMTYVAQFLHRYPEGSEGKVCQLFSYSFHYV